MGKLASVLTTAATVAVGVIGARAINDNEDSGSAKGDDPTAAIVVDADSVVDTDLTSTETSAVETGGGSGGSGAVPVGDEAAGAGLMFVDDPIEGPYALPERAFDSCAGSSAGAAAAAGCPVGYAGVLSGGAPPPPFVWGTPGRYLTAPSAPFPAVCPASTPAGEDHNAITVFSRTPLTALTVRWRPYGTSGPWVSLTTSATPAAELASWMARFAAEDYSREAFGYLTLCGIHIDRDPNTPYEVVLDATDSFGRPVSSRPFVMHDGSPSGRPPTQAYIVGDFAYIDAWAPATGSASFAMRTVTDPEDHACPPPGEGAINHSTTRDDQVFVSPLGVYDPSFNRKISTWVALPPGALFVVCTTIYNGTASDRTPLATDTHLLQGEESVTFLIWPWQLVIDLGGASVPANTWSITIGSAAEGCGDTIYNADLSVHTMTYYQWHGSSSIAPPATAVACQIPFRPYSDPYLLPVTVGRFVNGEWVDDYESGFVDLKFWARGSPVRYEFPHPELPPRIHFTSTPISFFAIPTDPEFPGDRIIEKTWSDTEASARLVASFEWTVS